MVKAIRHVGRSSCLTLVSGKLDDRLGRGLTVCFSHMSTTPERLDDLADVRSIHKARNKKCHFVWIGDMNCDLLPDIYREGSAKDPAQRSTDRGKHKAPRPALTSSTPLKMSKPKQ